MADVPHQPGDIGPNLVDSIIARCPFDIHALVSPSEELHGVVDKQTPLLEDSFLLGRLG